MAHRDDIDRFVTEAERVAADLRARSRAVNDTPTRDLWWQLRRHTTGVRRWCDQVMAHLWRDEHHPDVSRARLTVLAAVRQADTDLAALHHLADATGLAGVGDRRRDTSGTASSRGFTARYASRCAACRGHIRVGQAARYDHDRQIRHDQCPDAAGG